jgi:hypothetical protein
VQLSQAVKAGFLGQSFMLKWNGFPVFWKLSLFPLLGIPDEG